MQGRTAQLLALGGAVLLLGSACATSSVMASKPPDEGGAAPVDLLARGYLVRGQEAPAGYGYYAYLVFLDATDATRAEREAAVRAFARLLEDVKDVESLEVPRERLAVLFLPVKSSPEHQPAAMLEAYDYSFAQVLTVEIQRRGHALPRLCLIGSTKPIQPRSAEVPKDLRVVELKGDAQAIEGIVMRFRSSLLTSSRPLVAQSMLEKVRTFFESVGGFVLSVGGQ